MNRKLQALGLALFALVATAAVTASAAQATPEVTCSKYPCTIEATGEGVGEKLVVENGNKAECKVSHYNATLAAGSSTLTVTPTYTECIAFGLNAEVKMNGCDYLFYATERATVDNYRAHVDIKCPEGKSILIVAGLGTCEVDVGEQLGLTTVNIEDMTNTPSNLKNITITPTLTGPANEMDGSHGPIAYTTTKDGFGCPLNGTGNRTGGEYSTDKPITALATEDVGGTGNGAQVEVEVSGL